MQASFDILKETQWYVKKAFLIFTSFEQFYKEHPELIGNPVKWEPTANAMMDALSVMNRALEKNDPDLVTLEDVRETKTKVLNAQTLLMDCVIFETDQEPSYTAEYRALCDILRGVNKSLSDYLKEKRGVY